MLVHSCNMSQFVNAPHLYFWKLFGAAVLLALTVACQSNEPCDGPGRQKLELAIADSADFPTVKQYIPNACIPCLRNTFRNSTMPSCARYVVADVTFGRDLTTFIMHVRLGRCSVPACAAIL